MSTKAERRAAAAAAQPTAGNIARELANVPLHTADDAAPVALDNAHVGAVTDTAMGSAMVDALIGQMQTAQAATIAPVAVPFKLAGFKLNGKAKDYPSDDDPTVISRKVAFAVLTIGDSGYKLLASIYRVTHTAVKNDAGKTKVVTRCTMPNGGKMGGFKPIIDTDDPREQRALDDLRADVVRSFQTWLKETTSGVAAVTAKQTDAPGEHVDFE